MAFEAVSRFIQRHMTHRNHSPVQIVESTIGKSVPKVDVTSLRLDLARLQRELLKVSVHLRRIQKDLTRG